jgi:hypothetical protein
MTDITGIREFVELVVTLLGVALVIAAVPSLGFIVVQSARAFAKKQSVPVLWVALVGGIIALGAAAAAVGLNHVLHPEDSVFMVGIMAFGGAGIPWLVLYMLVDPDERAMGRRLSRTEQVEEMGNVHD